MACLNVQICTVTDHKQDDNVIGLHGSHADRVMVIYKENS